MSPVSPIFDSDHLYFITTTAVDRGMFFSDDPVKQIVVESLANIHAQQWINLYGFVIMPNHIHLLVRFQHDHTLADVMRDFKKFTSKQIVHHFEQHKDAEALAVHQRAAHLSPKQAFKVWEDGYDARNLFSTNFLWQKLEYIHYNPCRPRWRLAENPEDYVWSSARYYISGTPAIIPIDDVNDIFI